MSRALTELESYLERCEAMLVAATAQEWEDLVSLGNERNALAEGVFAKLAARLPANEQAAARTIMKRCQSLDAQVLALAEERQSALRVLLRVATPELK